MSAFIFCFSEVGKIAAVLPSFPLIFRALVTSRSISMDISAFREKEGSQKTRPRLETARERSRPGYHGTMTSPQPCSSELAVRDSSAKITRPPKKFTDDCCNISVVKECDICVCLLQEVKSGCAHRPEGTSGHQ